MLIDRNTQISQLRHMGILDNMVFSILRSNGYRNVGDILDSRDFEALGIKDYVVKSIKAFLRQMTLYDQPLDKVRENIQYHRNPQLEEAVDKAFADEEMVKAKEDGMLIFNDLVDVVSFIQINSDDEYYRWLDDRGIEDAKEADALPVTYSMIMKVRDNLAAVNRYNMYVKVIDHVLRFDRFRGAARQYNIEHGIPEAPQYRNRSNYRNSFSSFNEEPRAPFRNTPMRDALQSMAQEGRIAVNEMQRRDDNRPEQPLPISGIAPGAPAAKGLIPFRMIDDEAVINKAKEFFSEHGHYPMFSIIISYLKKAKVVGTVRLASVVGVNDSRDKDDWTKKEARRRYMDGVNRGLGLPDDVELNAILTSNQWEKYEFDKYSYISRKNFPFDELCQREGIDVSFNLFAFLVCIVRRMAMVNIQFGSPSDTADTDAERQEENIYSYVVPKEFTNFLYTSFVTVTANKKEELATDREAYKTYLLGTLSKRYWRGENLTQNRRLFVTIIKDILADILGLYAGDDKLVDEIDVDHFTGEAKPRPVVRAKPVPKQKRKYAHHAGKPTILDAVAMVIRENGGPMYPDDLMKGVVAKGASDNLGSIKVTFSIGRRAGKLNFLDDGRIDIIEEGYASDKK